MKLYGEQTAREQLTVNFDVQYRDQIPIILPRKVAEYFGGSDFDGEVDIESIEVTKYTKPYNPNVMTMVGSVPAKDTMQWHVKVRLSKPLEFEYVEHEVSVEKRTGYHLK